MRLLCMSFDGDYKLERPEFKTLEEVWVYSNDIGSKWYFYPFQFAVTNSGKTIRGASFLLEFTIGMRVETVARRFEELQKAEEAQNMDAETFHFYIADNF
jgi:hypothetical protein